MTQDVYQDMCVNLARAPGIFQILNLNYQWSMGDNLYLRTILHLFITILPIL